MEVILMRGEPSREALSEGVRAFAGTVVAGNWKGYTVCIFAYLSRGIFRKSKPDGFLVQFFRPNNSEVEELGSWGEADYTAETFDELSTSLSESVISWVASDVVLEHLQQRHPEIFSG